MALQAKVGYGQVEPNRLSAQRTKQIYAQLALKSTILSLENGAFMKYDLENEEVNATGDGEFLLHYSEEKVYGERETRKDFRLSTADAVDGKVYPRLMPVPVYDTFTTNLVELGAATIAVGEIFVPTDTSGVGILTFKATAEDGDEQYKLIKITTMPDGQVGYKFQRIPNAVVAA